MAVNASARHVQILLGCLYYCTKSGMEMLSNLHEFSFLLSIFIDWPVLVRNA